MSGHLRLLASAPLAGLIATALGFLRRGVEGVCTVGSDALADGRTANATALSGSHQGFARASVAAVERWAYKPARDNGQFGIARGLAVERAFTIEKSRR